MHLAAKEDCELVFKLEQIRSEVAKVIALRIRHQEVDVGPLRIECVSDGRPENLQALDTELLAEPSNCRDVLCNLGMDHLVFLVWNLLLERFSVWLTGRGRFDTDPIGPQGTLGCPRVDT